MAITKLRIYQFFLLSTSILTILDCLYLLFHTSPVDNSVFVKFSMCIIIRLVFAGLVASTLYMFGTRYQRWEHLFGHLVYFIFLNIMLFGIGFVVNYQTIIWSLVFQILHLYISLIYTFKCFLYHYDDQIDNRMDFGRRPQELEEITHTTTWSLDKAEKRFEYGKALYFANKNLMALSTMAMIILSICISLLLRHTISKHWSERELMKLKFVGEIFIRILLSLIVPLIGSSIAFACTGFNPQSYGTIMSGVLVYYLSTTVLATIEGLAMVTIIAPGKITILKHLNETSKNSEQVPILFEDTILDMIRNVFTDNIFQSWISTYHTKLIPPTTDSLQNLENWHISHQQESGANVMSVVLMSLIIGISANMIRTTGGRLIIEIIEAFNTIFMMITLAIVQAAPVCTVFLILPQIMAVNDLSQMFQLVGWFSSTVLISLAIHSLVVLPAIYFIFTRHNPYRFLGKMFPAISTAFATSSSSATMSITMQCLEENCRLPEALVRFIIPFGSTVNMDGAALYESVAAIFVAQYRQVPLTMGKLVSLAITSTMVSIGAAGIPQAGMITTVIVLNSIGLSLEDAAMVMVVDFFLDRFRTVVNVLGDAFGTAIINSRNRHMFTKNTNKKNFSPEGAIGSDISLNSRKESKATPSQT